VNSKNIGLFKPLIDIAAEHGIDTDALLGVRELEHLTDLSNPRMRLQAWAIMLQEAVQLTNDPAIGLNFGQRVSITSLGTLGFALMSCDDLEAVLRLAIRYHPMIVPEVICELDETPMGMALRVVLRLGSAEQQRLITESIFSSFVALGRFLLNQELSDVELHLNYPAPKHEAVYQQVFSMPVFFNQEHCQLVTRENKLLAVKLATANPSGQVIFKQQCELLLRKLNTEVNISAKVRSILMHASGHFPSINEVASKLFMGERTLRRRLKDEGTSFRRVFDEVRNVLACEYLTSTEITVTEIANLLGYSECVNFRRAFVRWNAVTPSEYREQTAV